MSYLQKTSNLIKEFQDSPEDVRVRVFINYCDELILKKEAGQMSIEDVGYNLTGLWLRIEIEQTICEPLTDLTGDMEIPRTAKYKQNPDIEKEAEWKEFVTQVNIVKTKLEKTSRD